MEFFGDPANSEVRVAISVVLAGIAGEHIGVDASILKAGSRGGNRPSTFASLGPSIGVFNEAAARLTADTTKRTEEQPKSVLHEALKGLGALMNGLPTGTKMITSIYGYRNSWKRLLHAATVCGYRKMIEFILLQQYHPTSICMTMDCVAQVWQGLMRSLFPLHLVACDP